LIKGEENYGYGGASTECLEEKFEAISGQLSIASETIIEVGR
jgi:hypothetical protein